ncbi:hypothetical protein [Desulfobulbus propionicus]
MNQTNQGDMPQQSQTMETIAASPPDAAEERESVAGQGKKAAAGRVHPEDADAMAGGSEAAPAQGLDVNTGGTAEAAAHQPRHQWAQQPLPPGYAVDPVTGRIVFVGAVSQQPAYQLPFNHGAPQPGVVYVQMETPEQAAARQAMQQQRYGQIVHSFEQFVQGGATVSDVVKTLYANTAQDDQLWKGVLVGAAATLLLTSKPVREAMGSVLPGLKPSQKTAGAFPAAVDPLTSGKE